MSDTSLRAATAEDAAGVTATVCEAYAHHIERIGKQPGLNRDPRQYVMAKALKEMKYEFHPGRSWNCMRPRSAAKLKFPASASAAG